MKRDRHYPVSVVERFFDPITVVNVDINVKHSRVVLKELEDSDHDIVHVTESRCFELFGMMESASPVHSNVAGLSHKYIQKIQARHWSASVHAVCLCHVESCINSRLRSVWHNT